MQQPYWHIERARIGTTRKVRVELIVNGYAVDTTEIIADGKWKDITFTLPGYSFFMDRIENISKFTYQSCFCYR